MLLQLIIICNRRLQKWFYILQYEFHVDSDSDDFFKCETPLEMSSL